MDEQFGILHCEPCGECRFEARQRVVDGRLRWEERQSCSAYGFDVCGGDWGPAPPWIRERIVAGEGEVRLAVGGPDGIPLARLREVMRLTLPELRRARADGFAATPVEAELLRAG